MIPSWYPTQKFTVGGFFQKQATLLNQVYDIRVLYGFRTNRSRKKWLFTKGLSQVCSLGEEIKSGGLREFRFEYISWKNDENSKLTSIIDSYKKMTESIIADGWKPDLIHAQCTYPAGIVALKLSQKFSIPWVLHEHQVFALDNHSKFIANLMRKAIKSANLVAVVSQHQLRCLATHKLFPRIMVIGNYINEEIFRLRTPQTNQKPFKILTVMWPNPIKDPETFFRAISRVINKGHFDIQATIIGKKLYSDNDISLFENLAEKYQVSDVCRFIPRVPNEEIANFYAETDIFVSTSVAETFGIAVREAMAVGRPVVCTSSGGVDDDIHDFNGIKVDIYDYEAIADALIAIKTGEKQYDPNRIREFIIEKYGRKSFLEQIKIFYEHALKT